MKTKDITRSALGAALMALSAWITLPTTIPFTLQTFMIAWLLLMFGAKTTTISLTLYLLLGAVGLPVFSGFGSGIGFLLGPSGGYLLGFLFFPLCYGILQAKIRRNGNWRIPALLFGLVGCYAFGSVQFAWIYGKGGGFDSIFSVMTVCVFPFIPFDVLKIVLADVAAKRLKTKASR